MQRGTIGGILCIVASILGAVVSLFLVAMPYLLQSMDTLDTGFDSETLDLVSGVYIGMGIIGLLLGGLGLVGGIFAARRKAWGLAIAGAVASTVLFFPLGIVAVILIAMGYPEFKKPEPVLASAAPPAAPPAL